MNRNKLKIALLYTTLLLPYLVFTQNGLTNELSKKIESPRYIRFMFYNCENLFDIVDDSITNDSEFLPDGEKYWNKRKYYEKLHKTSKVIMAVGGWKPPEIVGLCEIENKQVLIDLTSKTQLYQAEYKIIHKESPDNRGIDVGLLYQPKAFTPIVNEFIKVTFSKTNSRPTRDILYTKGITSHFDTLHIFINHWPSRWGGQLESEGKREIVARLLRHKVDSIFSVSPNANIIISGDLNDEPDNSSVKMVLKAKTDIKNIENNNLYNLTQIQYANRDFGSHKYQGNWGILDHIIVSGNLIDETNVLNTSITSTTIFNAPFLLEPDLNYLGERPNRTYIGFKHHGGFSDHLPVFIDLNRKK